jgi:hypothetical protein
MHSALAWCKRGGINQMIKLAAYRFQGIAGRSNVEHPIWMALRFIYFKTSESS